MLPAHKTAQNLYVVRVTNNHNRALYQSPVPPTRRHTAPTSIKVYLIYSSKKQHVLHPIVLCYLYTYAHTYTYIVIHLLMRALDNYKLILPLTNRTKTYAHYK